MAFGRVKPEGLETKTLRLRIKDKHAKMLSAQAREVNLVWNYINELSSRSIVERGVFLSAFDIQKHTDGATKEGLSLHSHTVVEIGKEYATRRRQHKKRKLRWRKSGGTGRSLGWIPLKVGTLKYKQGQVWYQGKPISLWDSYGLSKYDLRGGEFSEDSKGRWFLNVVVEFRPGKTDAGSSVGIDLGCKESAVTSDGDRLIGRRYRELEARLGIAQRAGKKDRVRAIHIKIANRRLDDLHKFSTKIAREHAAVFVGDVSSMKLAKTSMAKSVYDAGWGLLKTMLEYKCRWAGVIFDVVDERFSTQICSSCGCIPPNSPKGRTGLRIRAWTCGACGAVHDRDVNAAKNILAAGHGRLAGGNPESS